jgi:hypothetical protein
MAIGIRRCGEMRFIDEMIGNGGAKVKFEWLDARVGFRT